MYSSSSLDREITLQKLVTDVRNGVPVDTYADIFDTPVPAAFRQLRASERMIDGGNVAQRDCEFIVRWCDELKNLSPADRVLFEERVFDVQEVAEIGDRRTFLSLKAKERDQSNGTL